MAMIASFIGGIISTLVLSFAGGALANVALIFGPPEYLALTMLGLCLVAGITGNHPEKGYLMMFVGLLLGTVGIDILSGVGRFTFGSIYLLDGLELVPVMVGVFGFSEVYFTLEKKYKQQFSSEELRSKNRYKIRELLPSGKEFAESSGAITRGTIIGFIVGALPGAGATIASVLSYSTEKKVSKNRANFGEGAIQGVAVAEAAQNASTGGAMVPMLALGVPGSATTAILMTALVMFGITPGPKLFSSGNPVLWACIASMLLGHVILVIMNLLCIPIFTVIIDKADRFLMPVVAVLCIIGSYSLGNQMFDVWVMLFFSVLGYLLRKFNFDPLPMTLGLILGPLAEKSFRQSLILSSGDYSIFFTRPLSCIMLLIAVCVLISPLLRALKRQLTKPAAEKSA